MSTHRTEHVRSAILIKKISFFSFIHRGNQEPEAAAAQHQEAETGDRRADRAGRRRESDRNQAGPRLEEGVRQDGGQGGQGQHHAAAQNDQAQEGAEEEVEGGLEGPHREGGEGQDGPPEEAQREHQEEAGREEEEQAEEAGKARSHYSGILISEYKRRCANGRNERVMCVLL